MNSLLSHGCAVPDRGFLHAVSARVLTSCALFVLAVTADAQPPVMDESPTNLTAAATCPATFAVTATGADAYQWRFNGAAIPAATDSSFMLTNVLPSDAAVTELWPQMFLAASPARPPCSPLSRRSPPPPSRSSRLGGQRGWLGRGGAIFWDQGTRAGSRRAVVRHRLRLGASHHARRTRDHAGGSRRRGLP